MSHSARSGLARRVGAPAVAAVVVLALLAAGAWLLVDRFGSDAATRAGLEKDGLAAARTEMLTLTTLDVSKAEQQVQDLLGDATPQFRDSLASIATAFERIVVQSNRSSTGKIDGAGVQSSDVGSRTVVSLVAAEQIFGRGAGASTQKYRMVITMTDSGGRWLIADLTLA